MARYHPPEHCFSCGEIIERKNYGPKCEEHIFIGDRTHLDYEGHNCSKKGIKKREKCWAKDKDLQEIIRKAKQKLSKLKGDKINDKGKCIRRD